MKAKFAIPFLLAGAMAAVSTTASADEILNVLVGSGLGAAVGHAIGGHDGVLPGTIIGAVAGAAASQPEPRHIYERRTTVYDYPTGYRYYQPPVVAYQAPPVIYSTRVVYHDRDRHDWHGWREQRDWRERHNWRYRHDDDD